MCILEVRFIGDQAALCPPFCRRLQLSAQRCRCWLEQKSGHEMILAWAKVTIYCYYCELNLVSASHSAT